MLQEKIIWLLYLYFKGKTAVSAVLIWFIIPVIQDPVSVAVTLLQKGGFLNRDTAGWLYLTTDGWHVAEQIYEKRSFFMSLLMQAGVDFQTAQRDTCRIEHDISEDSFQKLKHALKNNGNI